MLVVPPPDAIATSAVPPTWIRSPFANVDAAASVRAVELDPEPLAVVFDWYLQNPFPSKSPALANCHGHGLTRRLFGRSMPPPSISPTTEIANSVSVILFGGRSSPKSDLGVGQQRVG
jgi:hypothetical protein